MASPVDSGDEGETLRDLDEAVCRILADTFHLMCRIRAAKDWPLLGDFAIAFADAIFKYEKADLDKIRAFAAKKNTTLDALLKKNRRWVLERCRRQIFEKDQLVANLRSLWEAWKNAKHPQTQQPVFDEKAHKAMANLIKLAEEGHVSDPNDVDLYQVSRAQDKDGLTVWRCIRGTNINECFHNKLSECLDLENCSIELADLLLQLFVDVYNQRAALRNIPGTIDHGHFDTGMIDKLNNLAEELTGAPLHPEHRNNTELYLQGEKVGVVRLYREDPSADLPNVKGKPWESYTGDLKYLSDLTGSKIPPVPIHTKEEHELYSKLLDEALRKDQGAAATGKPAFWTNMVEQWNKHVDGVNIFLKTSAHLKGQYEQTTKARTRQVLLDEMRREGVDFATRVEGQRTYYVSSSSESSESEDETEAAERAEAIARSTAPGPIPLVPSSILGDSVAPTATLMTTVEPPTVHSRRRHVPARPVSAPPTVGLVPPANGERVQEPAVPIVTEQEPASRPLGTEPAVPNVSAQEPASRPFGTGTYQPHQRMMPRFPGTPAGRSCLFAGLTKKTERHCKTCRGTIKQCKGALMPPCQRQPPQQ